MSSRPPDLETEDVPEAATEPSAVASTARSNPIVSSPYMTLPEAAAYVRCASPHAFSQWYRRRAVPSYGSRSKALFLKCDLDEALKPTGQRGRRFFFGQAASRRGRS